MEAGDDGVHLRTLDGLKVFMEEEGTNVDGRICGQTERW